MGSPSYILFMALPYIAPFVFVVASCISMYCAMAYHKNLMTLEYSGERQLIQAKKAKWFSEKFELLLIFSGISLLFYVIPHGFFLVLFVLLCIGLLGLLIAYGVVVLQGAPWNTEAGKNPKELLWQWGWLFPALLVLLLALLSAVRWEG